jgi:hypothetical protein
VVLVAGISSVFWMSSLRSPGQGPEIASENAVADVEEFIATVAWLGESLPDFSALNLAADRLPRLDDDVWSDAENVLLDEESN